MLSQSMAAWPCRGKLLLLLLVGLAAFMDCRFASSAPSDLRIVRPDRPNEVQFSPTTARFVRVLIHVSSVNQPCIDELEIYGPDSEKNLALAQQGGRPSASSCLAGYVQHAVEHLNDGEYGNSNSWIAAGDKDQWAQIELREAAPIAKVVYSRDRSGQFADRIPLDLEVQLSIDGVAWQTVAHEVGRAAKSTAQSPDGVLAFLPPPPPPPGSMDGRDVLVRTAFAAETPRQDEAGFSNLALQDAAQPHASSLLAGHAIHQIKHLNAGNSVHFAFAPLGIKEVTPSSGKNFQVRLTSAQSDRPLRITGNAPEMEKGLELAPGASQIITVSGDGPLGPEYGLEIQDETGATYCLHLFRYTPVERTLTLMEAMLARFEQRGLDVSGERAEWASLRERHANRRAAPHELAAERQLLFEAYTAKRRLFFRDPTCSRWRESSSSNVTLMNRPTTTACYWTLLTVPGEVCTY